MPLPSPPIYEALAVVEDQRQAKKFPKLIAGFEWLRYLSGLSEAVNKSPSRVIPATRLTDQAASIGVTPFPLGPLPAGVYRVSYYFRITQAATTSSSLQLTISWTDGGIALSWSGMAVVTNTTSSFQFDTLVIRADANTPISYSTTRASSGGTPMKYRLDMVVEALGLEAAAA